MSDKPEFMFHPFRLAAVGPLETIWLLWTQFPYFYYCSNNDSCYECQMMKIYDTLVEMILYFKHMLI